MRKILLTLIMVMMMIGLASANLAYIKNEHCIDIRVLANCSISLNEVTSPSVMYNISTNMDLLSGQTYNYTFCNTSETGDYTFSWSGECLDCSQSNCGNSFGVNPLGVELTGWKITSYILLFVMSLLIFIGLLSAGLNMNGDYNRDAVTGYIFALNNLKYLKYVCLALSYVMLVFVSYFIWMISYAFLDMDFVSTIFQFFFYIIAIATLPLFILFTYIIIANLIRDSKVADFIQRGLQIR